MANKFPDTSSILCKSDTMFFKNNSIKGPKILSHDAAVYIQSMFLNTSKLSGVVLVPQTRDCNGPLSMWEGFLLLFGY